jgi:hypothetical protein
MLSYLACSPKTGREEQSGGEETDGWSGEKKRICYANPRSPFSLFLPFTLLALQ